MRVWNLFRRYHYLNTDLHKAAAQYVGLIGDKIVCHSGVIPFPMRKGWDRIHRLVVLPDYQGIGIGTKFIKAVAEIRIAEGRKVNLTTTTPSLVPALTRDPDWSLCRYGRAKSSHANFNKYGTAYRHLSASESNHRITYSFNYDPKGR